jgi:hypothetical protein
MVERAFLLKYPAMATAIIGLLGVLVGLAVGHGYTFWAARHTDLAAAVVAAAALSEDLRALTARGGAAERERLIATWRDQRGSLVVHMRPQDFQTLGDSVAPPNGGSGPFTPQELYVRVDLLHCLFWEEHEAFILVPLRRYLSGNTLSKRIAATLAPD